MGKSFGETEWLTGGRLSAMLAFVRHRASARQLRLLGCASCRQIWELLPEERHRRLVTISEAYADGLCSVEDLRQAVEEAGTVIPSLYPGASREQKIRHLAERAAKQTGTVYSVVYAGEAAQLASPGAKTWQPLAALVREVFGNPFRAVQVEHTWLTTNVVQLARTIYEEGAFDRLPILADALMDAGCDNEDILAHCRSTGPHVRGCWVVDLLLAKEQHQGRTIRA